ncbi:methylmuconolactone methyl-isomerase [Paraburkholderia sp. RAU2J]|uniref:hypothetical protein n=1 Tax=Paraburkholderia sp. RAU2J TaxID=1938810 RepID=UPI000EB4AE37|nr:hypothetical protein [Paraburkholderia sp. RAU2J]RKT22167.1 methylmuconolactone methyl-isomerase [Paraburkholderia sp. RAU2J]
MLTMNVKVTVEQTTVLEVPDDAVRSRMMKRMSVIRRVPEMSESDFLSEWRVHADWVWTMPGVIRYRAERGGRA